VKKIQSHGASESLEESKKVALKKCLGLGGSISNAAIKSPSIKGNKCEKKEVVTNKVQSGGGKTRCV